MEHHFVGQERIKALNIELVDETVPRVDWI